MDVLKWVHYVSLRAISFHHSVFGFAANNSIELESAVASRKIISKDITSPLFLEMFVRIYSFLLAFTPFISESPGNCFKILCSFLNQNGTVLNI